MNIAFQIEAVAVADGQREIVNIDCDPTSESADGTLEAVEVSAGCWEFRFVLPDDFEESAPVFKRFHRYGLDPQTVHDTCRQALDSLVG